MNGKAQLEKEKKEDKEKLDKELKEAKEALANLKTQVSEKITPKLISKLEALSNKNLELKRIPKKKADGTEMKDAQGNIVYEEVLDLTQIETALQDLKNQKPQEQPNNFWSIGACALGLLSFITLLFILMSKEIKKVKEEE